MFSLDAEIDVYQIYLSIYILVAPHPLSLSRAPNVYMHVDQKRKTQIDTTNHGAHTKIRSYKDIPRFQGHFKFERRAEELFCRSKHEALHSGERLIVCIPAAFWHVYSRYLVASFFLVVRPSPMLFSLHGIYMTTWSMAAKTTHVSCGDNSFSAFLFDYHIRVCHRF